MATFFTGAVGALWKNYNNRAIFCVRATHDYDIQFLLLKAKVKQPPSTYWSRSKSGPLVLGLGLTI